MRRGFLDIFLLLMLIIASATGGFLFGLHNGLKSGFYQGQNAMYQKLVNPGDVPEIITIDQALIYIGKSRYTHQYFIDNPEKLTPAIGSLEFQKECVNQYDAIINLLRRLK